jgi:hypothetical protein
MVKKIPTEVAYHVLSHHMEHYNLVRKIFKTDYDSHMITITVFVHFLYGTLNPSYKKYQHEDLEWGKMYPLVKRLSKNKKKYLSKLSLFSISQILDMPKETVRRKVDALCKKKYLEYSVGDGITMGDNWESLAKKIAPLDFLSLDKAIKVIEKSGGIQKILIKMNK